MLSCAMNSENCAERVLVDVSRFDELPSDVAEHSSGKLLDEGCRCLAELNTSLLRSANLYRAGDEIKSREPFMELIQGLEWFVTTTSTVERQLKIDFAGTSCAGQTLTESVDGLNRVLLEIIVAQEHRDWVLLSDLLEYELAPQLQLWLEIFTMLRPGANHLGEIPHP